MGSVVRQGRRKASALQKSMLCLSVSAVLLALGNAAYAKEVKVDIPKQPLGSALRAFGEQTGLQILFSPEMIGDAQSSRVSGNMESETALHMLLDGTGYNFQIENGAVILLPATSSTNGITLQSTAITSQGMGEMTENSGSYTTGAVSVGSKTPTSLRDTPQSVSVLSSQLIEDRSITSLQDALKMAPGVTVQKTTSDTYEFYSRGFNIDSIQIDGAAPMALSSVFSSTTA